MKPKTQPVATPETSRAVDRDRNDAPEPLSGSVRVKHGMTSRPNNSDR